MGEEENYSQGTLPGTEVPTNNNETVETPAIVSIVLNPDVIKSKEHVNITRAKVIFEFLCKDPDNLDPSKDTFLSIKETVSGVLDWQKSVPDFDRKLKIDRYAEEKIWSMLPKLSCFEGFTRDETTGEYFGKINPKSLLGFIEYQKNTKDKEKIESMRAEEDYRKRVRGLPPEKHINTKGDETLF